MIKLSLPVCLCLLTSLFSLTATADDWPQWRGPNRDGVSHETGLAKEWPAGGPPVVWQVENAGVGYSSLVVKDGRVITQGDLDGVEHIIAYSENDGAVLWAVQPEPVAKALDGRLSMQFERFDSNRDGQLDEVEALAGLGWTFQQFDPVMDGDPERIAAARVTALLAKLDKDGDGKLSYSELPGAMQQNLDRLDVENKAVEAAPLVEQRATALLALADKDADGRISRMESRGTLLDRLYDRVDEKVEGTDKGDGFVTVAEMQKYFLTREPGRDGVVSSEELHNYYLKNQSGRDGVLSKTDLRRAIGGYRNSYGDGPRGTPTIDGNRVYAEGGSGDLTCLDAATGRTIWHLNLSEHLGGGRPGWGYSESPLVVDNWVIVTPGGKNGTLAALNKLTGEVVWRSTGVTQGAHYSSPLVAEIAGVRQIVQFANQNLFGVALDGGKLLWSYSSANNGTANIATPTIAGEYVMASSGYGTGTGLVKIATLNSTEQQADEVYFSKKLQNHHGGVIKVGDYVYGFGGPLVCMNFLTGDVAWQNRSVGKGSLTIADGMLYCLGEGYEVALVEATPEEYREHGRFRIEAFGRPAWAHPVVANGRLYLRNMHRLTAYDVRASR